MSEPLSFHWYAGVDPPFTGMAVYDTVVPAHTGLADAVIETLTGSSGFTLMVNVLEVAGLPEIQDWFDVCTHVIVFPSAGANE